MGEAVDVFDAALGRLCNFARRYPGGPPDELLQLLQRGPAVVELARIGLAADEHVKREMARWAERYGAPTVVVAGHRYAAGMAEAGEAIAGQELDGERVHSAKLRATIRLIEEALVSDGSKRPVWGEGDELDHVVWDVRTLCRKLDEAKAARDEWARQCNMASEHQADTANAAGAASAEVFRLKKMLEAERRDRGIWGDGGRDDLAVWYDGGEKVVARDAGDALEVWAAHNGVEACTHESLPDVPFERVPDDQEISIGLGDDGGPPSAKLPAKVWALIHGRGWLCTENF